jgi:predicted secreted protein
MRVRAASLVLLLLTPIAAACTPTSPNSEIIEIPCDRFSAKAGDQVTLTRTTSVARGGHIVLRLCSNPSTGFSWEDASISHPSVLAQRSRTSIPPAVTMPGAAGLEEWTFEATNKGGCTVTFSYSRPWDGGEKGAWRFQLDVTVT